MSNVYRVQLALNRIYREMELGENNKINKSCFFSFANEIGLFTVCTICMGCSSHEGAVFPTAIYQVCSHKQTLN